MRCPFCQKSDTRVVDSRLSAGADQVRRRRECMHCNARFSTHEIAELKLPAVVKSDGSRQEFSEEKLRAGLQRALQKRPVSTEQMELSLRRIVRELFSLASREVSSLKIGEWVMRELRTLDQIAYVRFASVYRKFEDVEEFRDEVDRLIQDDPMLRDARQMPLLDDDD